MAIAIIFRVPDAGQEEYDAVMEKLGPGAPGRLYHIAGPGQDGWRVVDVWETKEALEDFLAERLIPAAREVGFFAELPESFIVYNVRVGPD